MSKRSTNSKPIIALKVLPGEPLDGTGKVCIHLFVVDSKGPFQEPNVTAFEDVEGQGNRLTTKPARGRLACDPKRLVAPVIRNNVTHITMRTGEPSAVTCLKCIQSVDYKRLIELDKSTIQPTGA